MSGVSKSVIYSNKITNCGKKGLDVAIILMLIQSATTLVSMSDTHQNHSHITRVLQIYTGTNQLSAMANISHV